MDSEQDKNGNEFNEVDRLLKGAMAPPPPLPPVTLRQNFDQRIKELDISQSAALEILNIEWRALNGILNGTQKNVDFTALSKIARFLGVDYSKAIQLYLNGLDHIYKNEIGLTDKGKFILENFDLGNLKKAGIIDTINDFEQIELQIKKQLGLNDIFGYKRMKIEAAYSAGKIEPKNTLTRDFWIWHASAELELYAHQHPYNREALIDYFPHIRKYSMDVENGFAEVTRALFQLGVTVIFQPYFPTLHLRGATFAINDKPAIVITDYKGFYPTLWFALIHELYHVLFDMEEIKINKFHLSDEDMDVYTAKKKEELANKFARQYLFSDEKMNVIKPNINDDFFIEDFARNNHVHPSIIYIFHAFDKGKEDLRAWQRLKKKTPDIKQALIPLYPYNWQDRKSVKEIAESRKLNIFSNI